LIYIRCFSDCDSGRRGFESHQPPQNSKTYREFSTPGVEDVEDGAAQMAVCVVLASFNVGWLTSLR
jgi:hypothetical protein